MAASTRVGGRKTAVAGREYLTIGTVLVEDYYLVLAFPQWRAIRNNLISSSAVQMDVFIRTGGKREKVGPKIGSILAEKALGALLLLVPYVGRTVSTYLPATRIARYAPV